MKSDLATKTRLVRTRVQPQLRTQPRRPRGRPKAEHVEALEARLVLVAHQAFVRNGYGATSINSIAKSARVSKNTLYARFASKRAMFQAIVAQQIAAVVEELPVMSGRSDEPLQDKLRAYVNVAIKQSLSGNTLEINRLILSESHQFPELGEIALARSQGGVQRVAAFIEECARRDKVPCRDAASAASLLLSAVYGWYISIMVANRVVSDRERVAWVEQTVSIFMASRSAW
jgi:TetR/AcrR family transcriptional regulator, mexJK operon transcriptional repressor